MCILQKDKNLSRFVYDQSGLKFTFIKWQTETYKHMLINEWTWVVKGFFLAFHWAGIQASKGAFDHLTFNWFSFIGLNTGC